jgi:two-component system, OmpR family, sensor kinase
MSRLFVRIWLTFWAVLAATFVAALAIDYGLALQRARDIDRLSPQALAMSGAEAFRTGEFNGRRWILAEHSRLPELQIMVVAPDGREITGRSPAEVAGALSSRSGASPFPAAVVERVNGQPYRFVFRRSRSLVFDLWDVLLQPWVLAGLVLVISGAGSAFLARSFTGPIRHLQARVRMIASGSLDSRMGVALTGRGDELGVLAGDIDQMADRLQALIAARDALLRDVSHELRAPLARLRAAAELDLQRGGREAAFAIIDREIDRLDALIGQILRFSRLEAEPGLALEPVDLVALIEGLAEDARLEGGGADKRVTVRGGDPALLMADPRLMRSAVENVLRNAVRFSPKGGDIEIGIAVHSRHVRLQVLDGGPGVSPQDLPHIFEPFRGEGSGAGLGLAIARRIIGLHGGSISAENRPAAAGLVVTIILPRIAVSEVEGPA